MVTTVHFLVPTRTKLHLVHQGAGDTTQTTGMVCPIGYENGDQRRPETPEPHDCCIRENKNTVPNSSPAGMWSSSLAFEIRDK